jgi:hypothetical protein
MFQTHENEFNLLLNDPTHEYFSGLLLHEQLKTYTKDEFENQLILLSLPYYRKQLQQLSYNRDIDFKLKSKQIRKLKNKLQELQKGKLVDF